jgi:hypothetical protein
LALVVLVGLVLRWPGLDWGSHLVGEQVPYLQLHPDEPRFVEMARGLHSQTPFRKSYVMGFAAPQRLALVLTGGGLSDAQLVRVARVVSLCSGLALVVLVYLLTLRCTRSPAVSLTASGLVAVNTWCVTQSVYGTADMTYTMLLYLFALLLWRGFDLGSGRCLLVAAGVAGAAMSVKFGLVLLPSLLLMGLGMPRRRLPWAGAFLVVAAAVFLAAQGFAFDADSVRAIWAGFARDNLQGFEHSKWLNVPVYALQMVRIAGIPVVGLALFGWCRRRPDVGRAGWGGALALLPLVLHGVALLFMNLPFPRHLLPLLPLVLVAGAVGAGQFGRGRGTAVAVLFAWSLVLAGTDARALWRDARGDVMRWVATHVTQESTVWTSPYVELPVAKFYPQARSLDADVVILHEAWYFRFRRSELNPFFSPTPQQLYHAYPEELEWYDRIMASVADGRREMVFEAGPPAVLPEQIAYEKLWGSLNKFAGACRVLVREESVSTRAPADSQP